MNALFVVPFSNGAPQFPGLPEETNVSFMTISYSPPPAGTAPYVLVELSTTPANVTTLTNRADCLYLCTVTEEGYTADALTAPQRVAIVNKIQAMGFTGAQYGLLNAAIQSSQNRGDLAYAIGTKAFFRNVAKEFMLESDMRGAGLGKSVTI